MSNQNNNEVHFFEFKHEGIDFSANFRQDKNDHEDIFVVYNITAKTETDIVIAEPRPYPSKNIIKDLENGCCSPKLGLPDILDGGIVKGIFLKLKGLYYP